MVLSNGIHGRKDPAPVAGVWMYSHLVSTADATSVYKSQLAVVPPATAPWSPPLNAFEALFRPAPLVKSSSTAHTPRLRPTSPVNVNTPRSRVYQPLSLTLVTSGPPRARAPAPDQL